MTRCGVDADPDSYSLVKSVADSSPRDHRPPVMTWMANPNLELVPAPPSGDAFDLEGEHGGWRPA